MADTDAGITGQTCIVHISSAPDVQYPDPPTTCPYYLWPLYS